MHVEYVVVMPTQFAVSVECHRIFTNKLGLYPSITKGKETAKKWNNLKNKEYESSSSSSI